MYPYYLTQNPGQKDDFRMKESQTEIYRFLDPVEYLNFQLEHKRMKNPRFSLRAWSRQLGYKNPSFLSHLLKRKRKLKPLIGEKFAASLKLANSEKKYFDVLVLLENSKTVEEKKIYLELLESQRLRDDVVSVPINLEMFRIISDWYHLAILEMCSLKDFKSKVQYIFKRLGGEVSLPDIRKAIDRLLRVSLLKIDQNGNFKRSKDNAILVESVIPEEAIRNFHQQMVRKALMSIEEQGYDERDIRGSTLAIRKDDFSRVQDILRDAHTKVLKYATQGDADDLYFLSTQFFKLTHNKEEQ